MQPDSGGAGRGPKAGGFLGGAKQWGMEGEECSSGVLPWVARALASLLRSLQGARTSTFVPVSWVGPSGLLSCQACAGGFLRSSTVEQVSTGSIFHPELVYPGGRESSRVEPTPVASRSTITV